MIRCNQSRHMRVVAASWVTPQGISLEASWGFLNPKMMLKGMEARVGWIFLPVLRGWREPPPFLTELGYSVVPGDWMPSPVSTGEHRVSIA